ncbi:MAG: hypothetical protein LBJ20_01735 [Candidatus Methanoplasma sp.]|jgi:hypothetical protein|nr:hypothetical protein [Candidatus Methanoplasma sp.]
MSYACPILPEDIPFYGEVFGKLLSICTQHGIPADGWIPWFWTSGPKCYKRIPGGGPVYTAYIHPDRIDIYSSMTPNRKIASAVI